MANDKIVSLIEAVDDLVDDGAAEKQEVVEEQEQDHKDQSFMSQPVPMWLFLLTSAATIAVAIFV